MKGIRTIRVKLNLIIMVITVSALLGAGLAFMMFDLTQYKESLADELSILAKVIGDRSTASLSFDDPEMAERTLSA